MKNRWFSLPYLLWMAAFVLLPLGMVVVFAFSRESGGFTFDNLREMGQYLPTLLKSLKLALISTAVCLVLAYPLAYIVSRYSENKQRLTLLLVMLPMWMSFLLRTYAWMTLLENKGLINKLFSLVGLGPFKMINTEGAVILGMVYNFLPFMILPLYSVMTKIDGSIIEAAEDLGANRFHVVTKVLFPLSLPGIISGITMVFVPSVSTFMISRMLGGGSVYLIGDLIQDRFIGIGYNPYLGSAISLILMVVMLIIMGILSHFGDEEMEGMLI